jgi:hypothetical protein
MSKCPQCGNKAYLGFNKVECTGVRCPNFSRTLFLEEMQAKNQNPKNVDLLIDAMNAPKASSNHKNLVPGPKYNVGELLEWHNGFGNFTPLGPVTSVGWNTKSSKYYYQFNTGVVVAYPEDELRLNWRMNPPAVVPPNPGPTIVPGTIVVGSEVYNISVFQKYGLSSCSKGTVVAINAASTTPKPGDLIIVNWPAIAGWAAKDVSYFRKALALWP